MHERSVVASTVEHVFATCPWLTRRFFLLFQLFPSPTTGAIPSEPFNWMGTSESLSGSVKTEQRQYTDFTFQTAASAPATSTMTGAAHTASFPQSSVLMAPLVSN